MNLIGLPYFLQAGGGVFLAMGRNFAWDQLIRSRQVEAAAQMQGWPRHVYKRHENAYPSFGADNSRLVDPQGYEGTGEASH